MAVSISQISNFRTSIFESVSLCKVNLKSWIQFHCQISNLQRPNFKSNLKSGNPNSNR